MSSFFELHNLNKKQPNITYNNISKHILVKFMELNGIIQIAA